MKYILILSLTVISEILLYKLIFNMHFMVFYVLFYLIPIVSILTLTSINNKINKLLFLSIITIVHLLFYYVLSINIMRKIGYNNYINDASRQLEQHNISIDSNLISYKQLLFFALIIIGIQFLYYYICDTGIYIKNEKEDYEK